ncbi:hypothetical protein VTI74DRAFT_5186 [Chaetomium olivicolor]
MFSRPRQSVTTSFSVSTYDTGSDNTSSPLTYSTTLCAPRCDGSGYAFNGGAVEQDEAIYGRIREDGWGDSGYGAV